MIFLKKEEKKKTYDIGSAVRSRMVHGEETTVRGKRKESDDSP